MDLSVGLRSYCTAFSNKCSKNLHALEKCSGRFCLTKSFVFRVAIRSGDYYMFDELDDEELDLIDEEKDRPEDDDGLGRRPSGRTLGEVCMFF